MLPESIAHRVRSVSYPYPRQRQRISKTIRLPLRRHLERFVKKTVRVVVPRRLPLVKPSYVSLDRNRLNIHPLNRLRRLITEGYEFNRTRYQEAKGRRRQARNGQLESMRSDPYGMVAHAFGRQASMASIADHALVSRALSGW